MRWNRRRGILATSRVLLLSFRWLLPGTYLHVRRVYGAFANKVDPPSFPLKMSLPGLREQSTYKIEAIQPVSL